MIAFLRYRRAKNGSIPNREDGSALFLVVALLGAMSIFLATYLEGVHRTLDRGRENSKNAAVHYLAQAGVEKAIAELVNSTKGYIGEAYTHLGDGRYSTEVQRDELSEAYVVVSTGEIVDGEWILHTCTIKARITVRGSKLLSLTQREVTTNVRSRSKT